MRNQIRNTSQCVNETAGNFTPHFKDYSSDIKEVRAETGTYLLRSDWKRGGMPLFMKAVGPFFTFYYIVPRFYAAAYLLFVLQKNRYLLHRQPVPGNPVEWRIRSRVAHGHAIDKNKLR